MEKYENLLNKLITNLDDFDKKVKNYIISTYGDNTFENIKYTMKYNNEIKNVEKGIKNNTLFNKWAQEYNKLLNAYVNESYRISQIIGREKTLKIIDSIRLL